MQTSDLGRKVNGQHINRWIKVDIKSVFHFIQLIRVPICPASALFETNMGFCLNIKGKLDRLCMRISLRNAEYNVILNGNVFQHM